ncbi:MAG TPA: FUSC family membrane protein [Puia sp.]
MDYRTTYRSFINSYYLSEGIRITVGLTLPPIIGTYLHHEHIGITMSIGAICVTIVDNAGPVVHRKNAMLVCNAVIFIASLLTGFAVGSALATGLLIAVFCIIFSMIGVFGARAGSIGLAGLFVMVLNITQHSGTEAIILNAVYILCGGLWYMLLSLSLYSFRPYKVTQQALGDLIQSTGSYMLWRTAFYERDPDYDSIYSNLLDKQVEINDKQNLVRELLYKSRDIVKESTNTGRVTLLIFIDINDLFERMMSLQLHYKHFHQYFDNSGILETFKNFLLLLAEELNETGIALKSGKPYGMNDRLENALVELKRDFEAFRIKETSPANVEGFIGLLALANAVEDFVSRIHTIQQYTAYDLKDTKHVAQVQNYDQFVTHQDIDVKVFLDNFNWKSNTFRHALRVSFATTIGFVISEFFPFGHGYWILLTIIVILKPAYSITKSRNRDRLLGTIIGAGIGLVILFLVKDRQLMIGFMIVLMVLAYSFMRTRYLLFVTLMTPYILILLYILNPLHFKELIIDRVIDTAIGSGIALLANILFSPEWAYKQFAEYLQRMLEANKNYFSDVSSFFTGQAVPINTYKLSRKEAYVALANISDALNRMISEPKSKQKNATEYHELVVLNYMMSTHIATLASFVLGKNPPAPDPEYLPVVHAVISNLDRAIEGLKYLNNEILAPSMEKNPGLLVNSKMDLENAASDETTNRTVLGQVNDRIAEMLQVRKKELEQRIKEGHLRSSVAGVKSINDQFNFIWKISGDLMKIVVKAKIICFLFFIEFYF